MMVSLGKLPFVHRAFSANFVLDFDFDLDKLDHFQARSWFPLLSMCCALCSDHPDKVIVVQVI
jgi:hypothetical protein